MEAALKYGDLQLRHLYWIGWFTAYLKPETVTLLLSSIYSDFQQHLPLSAQPLRTRGRANNWMSRPASYFGN
jgi:hypothetical protein